MENARLKKKISDRERKVDTRRKIVAGSIVLKHAETDAAFSAELFRLLNRFVLPRDRHLFGLAAPVTGGGSGPRRQGRQGKTLAGRCTALQHPGAPALWGLGHYASLCRTRRERRVPEHPPLAKAGRFGGRFRKPERLPERRPG